MFDFLRSIGLHPIEWSEAIVAAKKPSPYVGEVLDAAFSVAQAIVVFMTPDDELELMLMADTTLLFDISETIGKFTKEPSAIMLGALRSPSLGETPEPDRRKVYVVQLGLVEPRVSLLAEQFCTQTKIICRNLAHLSTYICLGRNTLEERVVPL